MFEKEELHMLCHGRIGGNKLIFTSISYDFALQVLKTLMTESYTRLTNTEQVSVKPKSNEETHSKAAAFYALSYYSIYRCVSQRSRKFGHFKSRSVPSKNFYRSMYEKSCKIAFPPGALPEHTIVWARLPVSAPTTFQTGTYPWHLGHVVYARPKSGYFLAYHRQSGQIESLRRHLIEWTKDKHNSGPRTDEFSSQDDVISQLNRRNSDACSSKADEANRRSDTAAKGTLDQAESQSSVLKSQVDKNSVSSSGALNSQHPSAAAPDRATKPRSHSEFNAACAPWHYDYYIHFQGYNRRYDRWCTMKDMLPVLLNPVTQTWSRKAIARHIVSALSIVPSLITSEENAAADLTAAHPMCLIAVYVVLRILLGLIYAWDQKLNVDSLSFESFFASRKSCLKFLIWCSSIFRSSSRTSKSMSAYIFQQVQSPVQLAQIWWSTAFLAYFQLDLLGYLASVHSSVKKKKKSFVCSSASSTLFKSTLSSPPQATSPLILTNGMIFYLMNACPSNEILNACAGISGISFDVFQDKLQMLAAACATHQMKSKSAFSHLMHLAAPEPTNNANSVAPQLKASSNEISGWMHASFSSTLSESQKAATPAHPENLLKQLRAGSTLQKPACTIPDNIKHQLKLLVEALHTFAGWNNLPCPLKKVLEKPETFKAHKQLASQNLNWSGVDSFDDVLSDTREHEGMDFNSVEAHAEATKLRTIEYLWINECRVMTWYYSPFPPQYHPLETLYACDGCLEYFAKLVELRNHQFLCSMNTPPGNEIYRDGRLSFYEVDGEFERHYCERLSLIAKLFLDHKTLHYSMTPFLFYILIEACDDTRIAIEPPSKKSTLHRNQIVGYFSKEKDSTMGYNLACILTLPQHQRKGYGKYFIHFSYCLSKSEGKFGTPERPLSDLGRISYTQYWKQILAELLLSPIDQVPACACDYSSQNIAVSVGRCTIGTCPHFKIGSLNDSSDSSMRTYFGNLPLTVEDLVHFTAIKSDDIILTLEGLNLIQKSESSDEKYRILFDEQILLTALQSCSSPCKAVLPECFLCSPYSILLLQLSATSDVPHSSSSTPGTQQSDGNLPPHKSSIQAQKHIIPNVPYCIHKLC